ncbi:MAG: potassium-transporting ATPase subunit KdpA [Polyangiaceae bacterium]|nr:potassium-transporting ATPase subunit KdpA [Polyangiaceae bacterium]
MTAANVVQYVVFTLIVAALVRPAGLYMERVFAGEPTWLDAVFRPLERALYRLSRVRPERGMDWREYAASVIAFTFFCTVILYAVLRFQRFLPGGPAAEYLTTSTTPDLATNTAVSFSTTTTWQAYAGETTMKYAGQLALAAESFLGGAAGLAIGIAFIRGFSGQNGRSLGNFWVDLTRAVLWVLLPIDFACGLALIGQGVPMNFAPYVHATTLEGATQVIPQGPIAVFEIIENLGTNGGGFFNSNGAHPYDNPTGVANLIEMLSIVALPAGLTHTFGRMVGRARAGWALFGVMVALFAAGLILTHLAEDAGNPAAAAANIVGPNLEGKEVRFGIGASVLTAVVTSNTSCGTYNSLDGSYMPLGVCVLLVNMLLGEIIFGGLGTGLYSIVMVALIGLFLAGLMVGRTPEYLGKKIGVGEVKLVMIFTLAYPIVILFLTAIAVRSSAGLAGLGTNSGPRALTEVIFAYASSAANNGQNMAGLSANSAFYNTTTAIAMIVGRLFLAVPALALAGRVIGQGRRPMTPGTLPSDTLTFASIALATALLVVAVNFFPVVTLGPLLEHFSMTR